MLRVILTSIIVPIFSQFIIAGKINIIPLKRITYVYNVLSVMLFYTLLNVILWQYQINFLIIITFFYFLSLTMYYVHEFRGTNANFSDILSINTAKEVASGYTYEIKARFVIVFIVILIEYALHFFYYKINVLGNYHKVVNDIDSVNIDVYRFVWHEFGQVLLLLFLFFIIRDIVSINKYDYSLLAGEKEGYIYNFISSISIFHNKDDISVKDADSIISFKTNENDKSKVSFNTLDTKNAQIIDKIEESENEYPNVIVIMNESFGSVHRRIETNIPVTPYYDSLNGLVKGDLYVNTFGGGTANTEFEFLTGVSIGNYPYPVMPYNNFVKRDKYSIAKYFSNLGYETIAMHPYTATNYSRDKVYKRFGFDKLYFYDDFRDKKYIRKFVSDESMYEEVIRRYEETRKGKKKVFIFGITMQNHSGYEEFEGEEVSSNIENIKSKRELDSYLSLMKKSDDAIKILIDYFSKEKDHVILLFFGDHNASFGTDLNKMVYDMDFDYECTNAYATPFFIYNNRKNNDKVIDGVSANFLSIELFKEANLPLDMIHKYLDSIYKEYDVYNYHKMRSRKDKKKYDIKNDKLAKYEREYLS